MKPERCIRTAVNVHTGTRTISEFSEKRVCRKENHREKPSRTKKKWVSTEKLSRNEGLEDGLDLTENGKKEDRKKVMHINNRKFRDTRPERIFWVPEEPIAQGKSNHKRQLPKTKGNRGNNLKEKKKARCHNGRRQEKLREMALGASIRWDRADKVSSVPGKNRSVSGPVVLRHPICPLSRGEEHQRRHCCQRTQSRKTGWGSDEGKHAVDRLLLMRAT